VRGPHALLAGAVASFAAGFGALATLQHRAFETGRFDVGNLTQAVWSTAHGDVLEMTDLAGRQISRLGAHFDPLAAAFAPLWWLWPDPSLLLVVQAATVALGAIPVFGLAARHLGSPVAGVGFALAYLLYPPTQWLVLDDFHPVALATPLLLFALDYLDQDRLVAFSIAASLACLTKEHVGLAVAALGVWYALARRRRAAGVGIAVAGAVVAVIATTVIVPHFAPGGGSPFAGRYAEVGGGPGGILETAVTDPTRLVAEASEGRDLGYLVDLIVPLGGLPLLAPLSALMALPEIAANLLSSTLTQTSIHFHYTAAAIPGLFGAAIFGAARLQRRFGLAPASVPRLAVVAALIGGIAYGPLPLWSHVPLGENLAARDHVVTAHDRAAARAVRLVPGDVPVSATNTLGAHLSERRRVFSFPVLREARWVLVDTSRLSYRDAAVAPEQGARALRALRADPSWRVVFSSDGILILRRDRSSHS
jgi:uncharacterized membrane protein